MVANGRRRQTISVTRCAATTAGSCAHPKMPVDLPKMVQVVCPLPSGRTPRPFAVRVPRGPHSTPPTGRAGPTPTLAGCSRAAPERPPPKGSPLAGRNPSAPPIRPGPTTLRPRPDSPACFAIATPSPAPRPPSGLRSRRLTTFQVQDAGSTPGARHRADADRVAMGWRRCRRHLHRSFLGSRPLRGRLHFLRMTMIEKAVRRRKLEAASYFLYSVGCGPFSRVSRSQIHPSRV